MADLDRAIRLVPGNAAYWLRRADLLERDMTSPVESLERAAALNPFDSDTWIRLGLDAENRRDYARAESRLLQAARVSRRYQPRWTLANYYFRRGSVDQFRSWARQALELEPEYPDAIFQLCWKMPLPTNEIFENYIPPNRGAWRSYLRFLFSENHVDAAGYVVTRLIPDAQSADRDMLLEASDRFLASKAIGLASAAWNALCDRGLMTCRSIPASGDISLDDTTDTRALGHGFAWHIGQIHGVTTASRAGMMSVDFSGSQPENAEIAWRWIPVKSRQRLRLRFGYQTSGIVPGSGLTWQILGVENSNLLAASASLSNSVWSEQQLRFDVPSGLELVRVTLRYSRPPGQVRIDGSLSTRSMRIEMAP